MFGLVYSANEATKETHVSDGADNALVGTNGEMVVTDVP